MIEIQAAAALEVQTAERLIVEHFPDYEQNTIRAFVKDQLLKLNAACKPISAKLIAKAFLERCRGKEK